MPPKVAPGTEIIIALMGVTGAGKSYFIKEVTGNSQVEVGDGLHSHTQEAQSYSFQYEGAKITLVDTPGFNDTNRSDIDVLREITDWTSKTYREGRLLSGIIYLHPITHTRMEGSSLKNLRMFQILCGEKALANVLLTTTQWSNVDPTKAQGRENELRSQEFWGGLIDRGATLQRFLGTRESGLELIHKLMPNTPIPLDIQDQIVEQGMTLLETDAGQCINEELLAQEMKHKEEVESLEKERQEAIKAKDDEMNEILAAEQAKAQKKLEEAVAEMKLLAESHAAEIEKREAEESKREEARDSEERKRQEEIARSEKSVIAVATKDIPATAHIQSSLAGYLTKGRWILDVSNPQEFESNTFPVTIKVDARSNFRSFMKTIRVVLSGEGMDATYYIYHEEVRYVCSSGGHIEVGSRCFAIFRRG